MMESKSNAFQVQVPLLQASKSVMKILSQLVERVQGRCQSIQVFEEIHSTTFPHHSVSLIQGEKLRVSR